MPTYNANLARVSSGSDPLVPEPLAQQIIEAMPAASVVFGLVPETQRIPMTALTERIGVLSVLPTAYFTGTSDTALRQTTAMRWKNKTLIAEELNAIAVVPNNWMADAQTPIWDMVRPRIVEAIGKTVDAAIMFGTGKPSTWGPDIYRTAILRGNFVHEGYGVDLGVSIARGGELLGQDGYDLSGFVSRPGFGWKLVQMRSSQGFPIYQPDLQNAGVGSLYGMPLRQLKNGAWDATNCSMIGGDWSEAVVGMRQDINFQVATEGVIQDGSGAIQYNLLQQKLTALMCTVRLAWQVADPANALAADTDNGAGSAPTESTTRWPWFVLRPAGYTYS